MSASENYVMLKLAGRILIDSSSLILLQKSGLLSLWLRTFPTITTETVISEIHIGVHEDQVEIDDFLKQNLLSIQPKEACPVPVPTYLGKGEISLLGHYRKEEQGVLLVDDGAMARFCQRNSLRFISSILTPLYLYKANVLNLETAKEFLNKIILVGRFREEIIQFAKRHFECGDGGITCI